MANDNKENLIIDENAGVKKEIVITSVEELQELNNEIINNKEKHSFLELKIFSVKIFIYLIAFCILILIGLVVFLLVKTSNNEVGNTFINGIFDTVKVLFEFLNNNNNNK